MALIPVNRTEANLLHALARETFASCHYVACAARADQEGHQRAAVVFRYIARRRASHADGHLMMLDEVAAGQAGRSDGDTRDNLRTTIAVETIERSARYAGMARTARDEGFHEIADWFEMLAKISRSRGRRFHRALEALEGGGVVGFGE